jgi:O-antigen/teichoic acid export membrane protein
LYSGFILLQTLLLLGLITLTVFLDMGIMGAVLSLLAARAVTVVAMAVAVLREVPLRRPDLGMLRRFLRFGAPMVPSDLSEWAISSVDRYLIGVIAGIAWVGYYGPAYALGSIMLLLVVPMRFLLPAALAEMYDRGRVDRVGAFLRYVMKYFLVLSIPSAVGLGLLGRPMLLLLATEEIAREGSVVVPVVAMAMVLCGAQVILSQVLLLQRRTRALGAVMASAAALNVALNVVAIPRMDILGAALATLAGYMFAMLVTGVLARGEPRFELDVVAVGKSVIGTLAMMAVVVAMDRWWEAPVLVWTVGAALAGSGTFAATMLVLRTFSKGERDFLLSLLGRGRSRDAGRV